MGSVVAGCRSWPDRMLAGYNCPKIFPLLQSGGLKTVLHHQCDNATCIWLDQGFRHAQLCSQLCSEFWFWLKQSTGSISRPFNLCFQQLLVLGWQTNSLQKAYNCMPIHWLLPRWHGIRLYSLVVGAVRSFWLAYGSEGSFDMTSSCTCSDGVPLLGWTH